MGKIILSYNDVYEINRKLEEMELKFKVHLHDVCGSQSFTIEVLSVPVNEKSYSEMKEAIRNYFDQKHLNIEFLKNNLEFFIAQ